MGNTAGIDRLNISLLETCRAIYTEAIECLYSTNTFSFQNAAVLKVFLGAIPPQQHTVLQTVHLDLECAFPLGTNVDLSQLKCHGDFWKVAWDCLLELPALQDLGVRLHPCDGNFWEGQ